MYDISKRFDRKEINLELGSESKDIKYSARAVAYLGDAVFELCAREYLVKKGYSDAAKLNSEAKKLVSASAQAQIAKNLLDLLTDEETEFYKKGRNLGHSKTSKNITPTEYRVATGLETLFGELYLRGRSARINELFEAAVNG